MRASRNHTKTKQRFPVVLTVLCLCGVLLLARQPSEKLFFSSARKADSQSITVLMGETAVRMDLEEYLLGVTAAEMPASYAPEALKAQAVAARTYTLRKLAHGGCEKGADICTDSGHCQAYADEATLKERWGGDYAQNFAKIARAVRETAGEYLTYEGEAIDAMYHASAGGSTENSENVYRNAIPYLRGVESPDADGYEKTVQYSRAEFCTRMNRKLGTALCAESLDFEILSRYDSGRVKTVRLGEKTVSGNKFRGAAGLPSALFTCTLSEDTITFFVTGYGHGVGMSQSGANYYAAQGMTYEEILLHYYTGVRLEKI